MKQLTANTKTTIVFYIILLMINANDIQQDEIGEVEYIKVKANKNWKFSFEYFRYNDQQKNYSSHLIVDDFDCNMKSNMKNSVVHFQVNNDLRQVVLQGEQRQTNTEDSIIKIPLVNVLKKNIIMKPFCQQSQIDLYVYNFDHEFKGVIDLIQFTRLRNKFQPKIFSGYKYELMKLDLATQQLEQIQNLSSNVICYPNASITFTEPFKFEFYVIEGDGKITSRIKRNVKPDDNLNLLPSIVNSMDNRVPHCFWYRNNDNVKLIMRNMKFRKRQNEKEEYTLFQYLLNIQDKKATGTIQKLDDTNKEQFVVNCTTEEIDYLSDATSFEFKYIFIKGKSLLTEFTSQNRENPQSAIQDTMFIAHKQIIDFDAQNYDCKLHFINNEEENIVNGYFYFKHKNDVVDEYIKEEEDIKKQNKRKTYENFLGSFGDQVEQVVEQQVLQDDQFEEEQEEVEAEGTNKNLFEEYSEEEQERESESIQEDQETIKALQARKLFQEERATKMSQLLFQFRQKQQIQKETVISQDFRNRKFENQGLNIKQVKKDQEFESSSETLQRLRKKDDQTGKEKKILIRDFRAQQFQRFQQQKQNPQISQKNPFESFGQSDQLRQNVNLQRVNRLKLREQSNDFQRPLQLQNLNVRNQVQINDQMQNDFHNIDPRHRRFVPIKKNQFQQPIQNQEIHKKQSTPSNDFQASQRQNKFDRNNAKVSNDYSIFENQTRHRSPSLEPQKFEFKKPIKIQLGAQQLEKLKKFNINRQQLKEQIEELSEQTKRYRRQQFNNYRQRLYKKRAQSQQPQIQDQEPNVETNDTLEKKPLVKIKVIRKVPPQKKSYVENLRKKLLHDNQWFLEINQEQFFIKKGNNNVAEEDVSNFECKPFISEHAHQLQNLNDLQKQNLRIQWLNENTIFEREIIWEDMSENVKRGTWNKYDQREFSQSEFVMIHKLNLKRQYCTYKIHKDYVEIIFLGKFSNVTYHSVELKNNTINYEIYSNFSRKLIISCQQTLNKASRIPLVTAYFTDSFGIGQELKQKMITLTQFSRKFLVYDRQNLLFPVHNSFCVIDQGNYDFKQRIYLRTFEAPKTQNFQFVQVYFKDYKVNIFELHYKKQPEYQVLKHDFQSQLNNYDLETLYYIVNTFVNSNITAKTNLVNNGFKIRLPYLLLSEDEEKRQLSIQLTQIKNNNFLYIYLQPNKPNIQILRTGLFLTSNYQLNYFMENDHLNNTLQTTLERNEEIDNFIRVRQTNNQFFLYKNALAIQNINSDSEEYINIHDEPMRLLEGYYLETIMLDFLPQNYSMELTEAKVKLESFSIHIEQLFKTKALI